MDKFLFWVLALVCVVLACALVTKPADRVLEWLYQKIEGQIQQKVEDADEDPAVVEGKYIGRAERLFFTVVVALKLPGFLTAMMLWIGAKMAANWHRQEDGREVRARSIGALILGISSLGMALLVGLGLRMAVIHLPMVIP